MELVREKKRKPIKVDELHNNFKQTNKKKTMLADFSLNVDGTTCSGSSRDGL